MASISVPCPKTLMVAGGVACTTQIPQQKQRISFPVAAPNAKPSLSFGSALAGFQLPNRKRSITFNVQAALNDDNSASNSSPSVDTNSKVASEEEKNESAGNNVPDVSSIEAFMTQVSELVELVDSRDISELHLKQSDCELIIKKKEALQQPAPAPIFHMQPPYQQAVVPPSAPTPAPSPAPSAAPPALPAPSPSPAQPSTKSSSHPPLNCPMAGTFYRSPAPSAPPFVKVGDKVQKGQVVCIVEAMKLMNEIEADRSGTITEVLAEDGKPVSVGTPLFAIAP